MLNVQSSLFLVSNNRNMCPENLSYKRSILFQVLYAWLIYEL